MTRISRKQRKPTRPNRQKALDRLRHAQELSDRLGGPTRGMTEKEIIASIKADRNARWEAKFAAHT